MSYLDYVVVFDQMTDDRVIWRLYTPEMVYTCAPRGLSSLCTRDYGYWFTRRRLEHDVFIEEYHVHRVMSQFGLWQQIPPPWGHRLPPNANT